MFKKTAFFLAILVILSLIVVAVMAQDSESALVIDDFETEEVFASSDEFNNDIGHVTWGDSAGNVQLSIVEMEREGTSSSVLAINYEIGSWGGFTHALSDGDNWISQDWTDYNALQFWLYGNNTEGVIQVEIFDNRNPSINTDTAERWFFRISDDYEGWQQFTIPFENFQRRTDFQPGGAPNDGLGLDAVSGYAFGFPAGTGAQQAFLDDVTLVRLDVEPLLIDDFEGDELFIGQDAAGNDIGYVAWGDTAGNVSLRLVDAVRGDTDTRALTIDYDITTFGGFTHVFNDGENWLPQDWTGYNAISFWYLGSNTGAEIQFEIFDNRNPDLEGDSAERWFYRFVDDTFNWQLLEIPFEDFQRRSDWQPNGAPDDGLNLNAVHGYAFGLPTGTGSRVAFVDDVRLIVMSGVSMPGAEDTAEESEEVEESTELEPIELPEAVLNQDLVAAIPFAEPIIISDFEAGLPSLSVDGTGIGYVVWGDSTGNTVIGTTQVVPYTSLELPEMTATTQVFRIDYEIGAWGGFTYAFTDGTVWTSQDWTAHNALQFWLYGNNTGGIVQVEIFDNRNSESTADTAERYYYQLLDNYEGWQQFTVPFAYFQRRTDFQPGGAPDDGFNLDAVSGYAFGFPAGVGAQSAYIENVQIVVVEDPTEVQILVPEADVLEYEIDESITWDSREWELLWSDEFDAAAGTPINDEFWTCEEGGEGWGNNEWEYYTSRTENVVHDGNGNLVITAIEENLEDSTCWYGECAYTSARCITQDKVEFTYGRVEARLQIPTGQGVWPAFWMLGANFPEVGWPNSGEIDIMENIGSEPMTVHGTVHGPGYSGANGIGNSYPTDTVFSDDFHVYAIDWDENVIRWYVDGELFGIVSVNDMQGTQWVFNHDFFLLMNVAVGGFWPGYPDETTEFPQRMLIDYVRVYQ